jgi:hypothetical protein
MPGKLLRKVGVRTMGYSLLDPICWLLALGVALLELGVVCWVDGRVTPMVDTVVATDDV